MNNKTTIDDAMICPYCGEKDVYFYCTDEIELCGDGTGHYYADCHCTKCDRDFRLYTHFEYGITKYYTNNL